MKYALILLMLVSACDMPNIPIMTDVNIYTDVRTEDSRRYHEDSMVTIGPEKDAAIWLRDQEVSVTTNFPAPSWWQ